MIVQSCISKTENDYDFLGITLLILHPVYERPSAPTQLSHQNFLGSWLCLDRVDTTFFTINYMWLTNLFKENYSSFTFLTLKHDNYAVQLLCFGATAEAFRIEYLHLSCEGRSGACAA